MEDKYFTIPAGYGDRKSIPGFGSSLFLRIFATVKTAIYPKL
jgi:hypothetical protein